MTALRTKPWRIDRQGERIYIDAPREVCVDICSGAPEDRARVMALLAQVQNTYRVMLSEMIPWEDGLMHDETRCGLLSGGTCPTWCAEKRAVLRDAGVMSDPSPMVKP